MEDEKVFTVTENDNKPQEFTFDDSEKNENYSEQNEENSETKKSEGGFLRELYEWTQAIAIAIVLALVINHFVFSIVQVQGASMEPTLNQSERLFVFKSFYKPKNKDIVIIKSEQLGKFIVKRVIATSGQIIDIDTETGKVSVDGELLNEPYINKSENAYIGTRDIYPLEVPEGHVFVMGDNRGNSLDSRALGVIDNDDIMGKAVFRIWPIDSFGGLYGNLE